MPPAVIAIFAAVTFIGHHLLAAPSAERSLERLVVSVTFSFFFGAAVYGTLTYLGGQS